MPRRQTGPAKSGTKVRAYRPFPQPERPTKRTGKHSAKGFPGAK